MIVGPKIEACAPGRHCRHFTCNKPVRYRVQIPTVKKRVPTYYQTHHYCAEHAEIWAAGQNMTLPEAR